MSWYSAAPGMKITPGDCNGESLLSHCLDFVEEEQALSGHDVPSDGEGQLTEDLARVVAHETARGEGVLLEVDLDQVETARLGEVTNQPGLANLARSADDQRLAKDPLAPSLERVFQPEAPLAGSAAGSLPGRR